MGSDRGTSRLINRLFAEVFVWTGRQATTSSPSGPGDSNSTAGTFCRGIDLLRPSVRGVILEVLRDEES